MAILQPIHSIARKTINVMDSEPIIPSEEYLFPPSRRLFWPNNTANSDIIARCASKPPSNAMYRISYGDGLRYNSWTKVPYHE